MINNTNLAIRLFQTLSTLEQTGDRGRCAYYLAYILYYFNEDNIPIIYQEFFKRILNNFTIERENGKITMVSIFPVKRMEPIHEALMSSKLSYLIGDTIVFVTDPDRFTLTDNK